MKRNLSLSLRVPALVGLVMVALAAATLRTEGKSEPFSHIVVFGDSLSDIGNYYHLSGGLPAAPYVGGRYCNGPVWVESLAESLRMEYVTADNFAVAGATTGTLNLNNKPGKIYPGLLDEISAFESLSGFTDPDRALYVVWAGANDFFLALNTGTSPSVLIGNGVHNTVTAVQQLWATGARNILVMNLPDLGVTPLAQSMAASASITLLSAAYNQVLDGALKDLAQAGIPTIRVDTFTLLHTMAATPATYGFSNVTTPLMMAGPVDNPDEFLFWDPVHPTTRAHNVLAHEALEQLISAFSPSQGQGTPDARANALHGLVNAGSQRP